ncbi:heptosyltransferase I [Betaproteobacteria bacterium]|nr:heptosyltransferase I [Betaproteobacteria bacterium]
MRILIVKTSSLGDVIHTLPAVTDAARAIPGLRCDWVVEEAFAEIPAWHPAVEQVIPVALRRWRKHPFAASTRREWRAFRQRITATEYDLVIDAQGLFKSAWLAHYARGPVHGLDRASAREPLARLFYAQRHAVPWGRHAVRRVRELFAAALAYPVPAQACGDDDGATVADAATYGLDRQRILAASAPRQAPGRARFMFLHGTTWPTKHYPESAWRELAAIASTAGAEIHLPWGNEQEHARAERIAAGLMGAQVLPKSTLAELAAALMTMSACVAVDTGLGHLAAALDIPTLSLFGPTHPGFTGAWGRRQQRLAADFPCAPCLNKTCHPLMCLLPDPEWPCAPTSTQVEPPCFSCLPPQRVWAALSALAGQTPAPPSHPR